MEKVVDGVKTVVEDRLYLIDAGSSTAYIIVFASIFATTVLWVTVTLLTRPDPMDRLVEFYRRARPMGWWGPVAREAGIDPSADGRAGAGRILRGFGVAVLGLIAIAAGTLAFHTLYLGQWGLVGIMSAVSLVAGLVFLTTYRTYMRRLDVEDDEPDAGE